MRRDFFKSAGWCCTWFVACLLVACLPIACLPVAYLPVACLSVACAYLLPVHSAKYCVPTT
jgi:hypothetical protein